MKHGRLVTLIVIVTSLFLITSCFWKKDKEEVTNKSDEGKWVQSQQRRSKYSERKSPVTYSKRPYGATEEEKAAASTKPQKTFVTPYLLGRLKYKVVVTEFRDKNTTGRKGLGSIASQELTKQLEESGAVVVVDLDLVKKSLGSKDAGFLSSSSSLWKLRTILGVQGVVTGSIQDALVGSGRVGKDEEAVAVIKIEGELLDTEIGSVTRSVKGENPFYTSRTVGEMSKDQAITKAIQSSLEEITEGVIRGLAPLEWTTSVASIESNKVYLNAGKMTGLKEGDILEVRYSGRIVRHSLTGASLGRMPGAVKGKLKVSRVFGVDASEAEKVSGGSVATGDVVIMSK